MKKEEFYEVLGDIDENAVKEAEQQPPKIKRHWGGIALATAACLCAVLAAGIMMNLKDSDIDSSPGNSSSAYDSSNCSDADNSRKPSFADVDIYAYQNGEIIKQTQNVEYSDAGVFSAWLKLNGLAEGEKADELAKRMHYSGDYLIPAEEPKPRLISDSDGSLMIDESFTPPTNNSNGDRCAADVTVPEEFKEFYNKIPKEQLEKSLMLTLQSYAKLGWAIDELNISYTSLSDYNPQQPFKKIEAVIYSGRYDDTKEEKVSILNDPNEIFNAWKKSNGIGDEVKLLRCKLQTKKWYDSSVTTALIFEVSSELLKYEPTDVENEFEKHYLRINLQSTFETSLGIIDCRVHVEGED